MDIIKQLGSYGVIPVVTLDDTKQAIPLASALIEGGIQCAEVTFRTNAAKKSIENMVEAFPDMLVGAGTVLSCKQVDEAVEAGARFIVTPGFNEEVVEYCILKKIPIVPGCMGTYAIERAMALGLDTVKFFPAEAAGGINMIKALSAPYKTLRFMPTGGINAENVADYLSMKQVLACGGTWMVNPAFIKGERFEEITRLVREAVEIVREVRA